MEKKRVGKASIRATKESIPHCLGETPIFLLYLNSVGPEYRVRASVGASTHVHTRTPTASQRRPGKFGMRRCISISLLAWSAPFCSGNESRTSPELWPIRKRPTSSPTRRLIPSVCQVPVPEQYLSGGAVNIRQTFCPYSLPLSTCLDETLDFSARV